MGTIYKFGPFGLDADADILFRDAEPTMLGQRAVSLLRLLLERAGAPVSKDALMEAAWPGVIVEESNLTVQIAALRRVFEEEAGGGGWIETLPRRGYRYVGPPVATDQLHAETIQFSRTLALPGKPSVAVLPFSNLSGDSAQEYFAEGMVDDIITGLSRIKWLFVIARNSTFAYKGREVDVKQVGRELGVRYMLEGSVRKLAHRVRITGQLIDTATGAHGGANATIARSTMFSPFRMKSRSRSSERSSRACAARKSSASNASGQIASMPMISCCRLSPTSTPGCQIARQRRLYF